MIISLREKLRECVKEINKKYKTNFTLEQLERDLGHKINKTVIDCTLQEMDQDDLSLISGGVNVYNPNVIGKALISLALATGHIKNNIL